MSLMVWGAFLNAPGCAEEGTIGLGNPLHRFLLSTTTDQYSGTLVNSGCRSALCTIFGVPVDH